ncbi:uncharacterized protein DSM5745_07593 [Aspergillus mulundensis]|uniref:Major facilitator superfamily (MFS) profile domain-containing protein n=1 Tax=Aspergillus mulundensis TaxID=1810919 RepID=A0A3D8REZ3_9EURO|nr:hypothetical protein DSM5745_07593 [Aspergillus mulundensis]RDW72421.1 hypothetical protein DSM5745_07593 [Aspergillus mulundensis]
MTEKELPSTITMDAHCLSGLKLYSVLSDIMVATTLISLNASIFSLRWSCLVFFGIFLLGSVLCGAATSSTMFIIGRAVAGIGGAGIVSDGISVIALATPTAQRPLSFFHPPKSTAVIQQGTPIRRIIKLDLIGGIIFVGLTVMVFLAFQWGGGEYAWDCATIIGLFFGFGVSMLLFIAWEMYKGGAVLILLSLPERLFSGSKHYLCIRLHGLLCCTCVLSPRMVSDRQGRESYAERSGVMLLPSVCTLVFGAIVSGVSGMICLDFCMMCSALTVKTSQTCQVLQPLVFIGPSMLCIACVSYTTFTPFPTSSGKWIGF